MKSDMVCKGCLPRGGKRLGVKKEVAEGCNYICVQATRAFHRGNIFGRPLLTLN